MFGILSDLNYIIMYVAHRDLSWVKIYNVDQRYEANRIDGEFAVLIQPHCVCHMFPIQ